MKTALVLAGIAVANAYQWPSPLIDQVEGLLYEGRGEGDPNNSLIDFAGKLAQCQSGSLGESGAAEWIRFAYHDMATHNIEDGTGGLDNSLLLELDRAENVGVGMKHALADLSHFPNKYLSFSDVTAVGVAIASAQCQGPIVPIRAGRRDAIVAGPPGVPEPQQTLAEHTESFRLQGFTPEEMIALTACGHSVGGVRSNDFPAMVPPAPGTTADNFILFDTTTALDNTVVLQYLNSTTKNALVVDKNVTLISDFRIFNSDGNVTMNQLADPETFDQTCSRLFAQMINTVPAGVTLTDVIEPILTKVDGVQLSIGYDTLLLSASLRFLNSSDQRTVKILWNDKAGGCASGSCFNWSQNQRDVTTTLASRLGLSVNKYDFVAPINATTSISKFWFEINENDGSPVTVLDNEGSGYVITQDRVLYVPHSSTATSTVVAVRNDVAPSRVFMDVYTRGRSAIVNQTVDLAPSTDIESRVGYAFYSLTQSFTGVEFTFDLHSIVNGTTYTEDMRDTYFATNSPDF
ncbi:L-ascorbate oxidase [Mycena alexandri]|uniref:Peroxidase n=1 Tax=Mycena alexandri TaxID=1745969 RepID=A0AAD6WXU5_9AGAR|nr:L-ascorbate oxidase [Mycena alexandri]